MPKRTIPRPRRRIGKQRRRWKPPMGTRRVLRRKRPSSPPAKKIKFKRRRPLRRRRHPRRRLVRVVGRRPLWWEPSRVIIRDEGGFPTSDSSLTTRLIPEARRALRRVGLAQPFWVRRLAQAKPPLIRFINRFYRVAGFEHVVRLYFGGRYQRAAARMLLRLARRRGDSSDMRFYRSIIFAPDGLPLSAVILVRGTVHYVVLPWSRLQPRVIRQLVTRQATLFDKPEQVRLVFDGRLLSLDRSEVIGRVRGMLRQAPARLRRWTAALPDMIVLL